MLVQLVGVCTTLTVIRIQSNWQVEKGGRKEGKEKDDSLLYTPERAGSNFMTKLIAELGEKKANVPEYNL